MMQFSRCQISCCQGRRSKVEQVMLNMMPTIRFVSDGVVKHKPFNNDIAGGLNPSSSNNQPSRQFAALLAMLLQPVEILLCRTVSVEC